MAAITPIPSTRVTDSLARQRLLTQLQSDEAALFHLQTAISTGRRFLLPSEDPSAAQRGISLQSLLERKRQVATNGAANQSFLTATDSALSSAAGLMADVRADALSVSDNISTPEAKRTVASQVDRALQQLLDAANQQFRGRRLFAGSKASTRPFELVDGYVRYNGDEASIQSYADIDLLLASNVSGHEVFGAFSSQVQGSVDLSPDLTASTLLTSLRGGQGVSPGSIAVSDGSAIRVIDLSNAKTVGDLKELLEANPPAGRVVTVTIGSNGLNVQLDGFSGAGLTIKEVGDGTTAAELGILAEAGTGVGPVIGADLNPLITKTTLLTDLPAVDLASGLQIVNGGRSHTISFAGAQTVEDLLNKLNGSSAGVLAEINAAGTGVNLRSRISGGDFAIGENGGTTAADLGVRSFTAETQLDSLNLGFGVHMREGADFQVQLKNGTLLDIDLAGAKNIGDVLSLINTAGGGQVTARLARFGNGIELETSDGSTTAEFAVLNVFGSQAATDLGLIPEGLDRSAPATAGGGVETITGRDVNPLEVKGVFSSLVRLKQALVDNDLLQIDRSIELLDDAALGMTFARAEVGARQQVLDVLAARQESERVNLEDSLSQEIDVDLVQAISDLTARQAAYQASLQLAGRTLQLTLLDFL